MKARNIGKRLMDALTQMQMIQFMDAMFALWDEENIEQLLSNLDNDIAMTVSQIFSSENIVPVFSDKKYIEEWKDIWNEWFAIVNDVGDENGKYVSQDNDWESPYFNTYDMAVELDRIAEKMLPLLEKIYALGRESDGIFEEAIEEIEDNIMDYPEWMGAEEGECYIGNIVTQCLLRWKWLAAKDSPIIFLNSLLQVQNGLRIIEIDRDTIIRFFIELSEDNRKEIYDYMTLNRDTSVWNRWLNSVHSEWHQIYHLFSEEFSMENYLENCHRLLHENWQYGLPLIEDFLKKENYAEAEKVYEETISSYASRFNRQEWNPEESLLLSRYSEPDHEIIRLLKEWISIAERLEMKKRVMSLKLQMTIYQTPYDWDNILKTIQETDKSEVSNLIGQWQNFILTNTLGRSFVNINEIQDCWIKWLLDAALDETKGREWFGKKIEKWLTILSDNSKEFQKQWRLIDLFTDALAEISDMGRAYPHLVELAQQEIGRQREENKSCQNWLKKMEPDPYIPMLINCWKNNVAKRTPDPGDAHNANYDFHALCLCVLKELDTDAYQEFLEKWKKNHKRRRNLWKAIEARSVSV